MNLSFSDLGCFNLEFDILRSENWFSIDRVKVLCDIDFNPIWTGGGAESAPPQGFSSITPKRQEILKRNFLTLNLHL